MPYNFNHPNAGLRDIRLAGWFLVLPFDFGNGASLVAKYHRLAFAAHLVVPVSAAQAFRTESIAALITPGAVDVKLAGSADSILHLQGVQLDEIATQQSVREAETIWGFRGLGAGTAVSFLPARQSFPFWGHNGDHLFGWAGSLDDSGNNSVSNLAYAQMEWTRGEYFSAAQFAGLAGIQGVGSLFNTLKADFSATINNGGNPDPQPGNAGGRLTLNDRRRDNRQAQFLGADSRGVAQVAGAHGAIWIGHGSFLSLPQIEATRLARQVHNGMPDLRHVLGRQPLIETIDLRKEGPATNASATADLVFEGLSLWDLQPRGNVQAPVHDSPCLL